MVEPLPAVLLEYFLVWKLDLDPDQPLDSDSELVDGVTALRKPIFLYV